MHHYIYFFINKKIKQNVKKEQKDKSVKMKNRFHGNSQCNEEEYIIPPNAGPIPRTPAAHI